MSYHQMVRARKYAFHKSFLAAATPYFFICLLAFSSVFQPSAYGQETLTLNELKAQMNSDNDSLRFSSLRILVPRYLYIKKRPDSARYYYELLQKEALSRPYLSTEASFHLLYTKIQYDMHFHEIYKSPEEQHEAYADLYTYAMDSAKGIPPVNVVDAFNLLAVYFYTYSSYFPHAFNPNYDTAIYFAKKGAKLSFDHQLWIQYANAKRILGNLFAHQNKYYDAIEECYEALDVLDKIDDNGADRGGIGSHSRIRTQAVLFKALYYVKDTARLGKLTGEMVLQAGEQDDATDKARAFKFRAHYYDQLKNDEKTIEYLEHALEQYLKINFISSVFEIHVNLSYEYAKIGRFEKALYHKKQCEEIMQKHKLIEVLKVLYHLSIMPVLDYQGDADELQKSLLFLENCDFNKFDAYDGVQLYPLLQETYDLLGDIPKAYAASEKYHRLNDSLNSLNLKSQIAFLQTKYETQKKEQEIANLQQTAEIQSLALDKKNNQIIITSLVVLVFAISGFLYYRQYKIKRDKASLELEQRFLRSQLNPHFIFNSMGAIQNYLLTENTEKATHYMSMFSGLMRQILEHSRKEFIPLSEEIDMLNNYLKLQELRFSESFTFKIDLDENLDEDTTGIPPMFAQPFIENALEHGLFKKGDHNEVRIKFMRSGPDLIQLEILDSGVGVKETLVKVKEHRSLATQITNERLEKMSVSSKAKLRFDAANIMDENGNIQGYRVQLSLPSKLIAA